MKSRYKKNFLVASSMLLAVAALAACGGGSGLGGLGVTPPNQTTTGSVTVALADAPLSQLATFSIDITGATLKGTGSTTDAVIFPTATSASSMSVDLLSLQGLNQLFAQATVPVGTYARVEIAFLNASAIDLQNVAQQVTSLSTTLNGVFAPTLNVAANSNQSIQVDVDLSRSVFDLGGNSVLFSPNAAVVQTNQPIFLHAFPAIVTSINTQNDSFEVNQLVSRLNSRLPGSVTIQCSPTTTYYSSNPPSATLGSVTPVSTQVAIGNNVLVKGSLVGGLVQAERVSEMPSNIAGPIRTNMSGVITAVNGVGRTLTFKLLNAVGSGTLPARFSDITVTVPNSTVTHRGRNPRGLGDFKPGNRVEAALTQTATGWEASSLSEEPALVRGTVVSVTANAGNAQGSSLLSLTPEWVEQIPVAVLGAIIPSPLNVDVPANFPLVANDPVRVFGYFNGTNHLDTPGVGQPTGPVTAPGPNPNPGNNNPGTNNPGPNPAPRIEVHGEVAPSTTASINAGGDIEFTLAVPSLLGPQNLSVTVSHTGTIEKQTQNGIASLSVSDAVSALNANPQHVVVWGSQAPVSASFTANLGLRIMVMPANTNPNPNPNPNPLPPAPPTPPQELSGVISGTAAINGNGDIEFTLVTPVRFTNLTFTTAVTVDHNALKRLFTKPAANTPPAQGTNNPPAPPQVLTVAQAVAALNASPAPFEIHVIGGHNPQAHTFDCDIELRIIN